MNETDTLACAQKLTISQSNLAHGTRQLKSKRKLKKENRVYSRTGSGQESVKSLLVDESNVYGGKDLWKEEVHFQPESGESTEETGSSGYSNSLLFSHRLLGLDV